MEPWERLSDLLLYLQLKDHEFKMMYGFDRDDLFEIDRKISNMSEEELRTLCNRLFINEDYVFGKSERIIPTTQVYLCLRGHFEVIGNEHLLILNANQKLKPLVIKAIGDKPNYCFFKGIAGYRIKGFVEDRIKLDDREIRIIAKKLGLDLEKLYQCKLEKTK